MIYRHPPQTLYRYDRFKLLVAVLLVVLLFASAWFLPQDAPLTGEEPALIEIMPPILLEPDSAQTLVPGPVALSGRADPNARVRLSLDGAPAGIATADAAGTWQLTTQLEAGIHTLLLETLDEDESVLATAPPVTLTVVEPTPAAVAPTIDVPAGEVTAGTLTLSGTADPGTNIVVVLDGQEAGTTMADDGGAWSLPLEVAAGQRLVSARAVVDGTVVGETEPLAITVAAPPTATPEATPEPVEPTPEVVLPAGTPLIEQPQDGSEIAAGTVTFSGTGLPGRSVSVVLGVSFVASTQVDESGSWSVDAEVPPGTHTALVESLDADGRRFLSSPSVTFTAVDAGDS